jgi:hypothetical protein
MPCARLVVYSREERRSAMPRYLSMNARPNIRELDRVRRDIGARLRIEYAVTEPAPENIIALLKELATSVRDTKREKLFAEVDAQVAEVLRAAGRRSSGCAQL